MIAIKRHTLFSDIWNRGNTMLSEGHTIVNLKTSRKQTVLSNVTVSVPLESFWVTLDQVCRKRRFIIAEHEILTLTCRTISSYQDFIPFENSLYFILFLLLFKSFFPHPSHLHLPHPWSYCSLVLFLCPLYMFLKILRILCILKTQFSLKKEKRFL